MGHGRADPQGGFRASRIWPSSRGSDASPTETTVRASKRSGDSPLREKLKGAEPPLALLLVFRKSARPPLFAVAHDYPAGVLMPRHHLGSNGIRSVHWAVEAQHLRGFAAECGGPLVLNWSALTGLVSDEVLGSQLLDPLGE